MFTRVTDMLWTRLSSRQASATLTPFAKLTGGMGTEPGMQRHAMVGGRECRCPMQVQDPPPEPYFSINMKRTEENPENRHVDSLGLSRPVANSPGRDLGLAL